MNYSSKEIDTVTAVPYNLHFMQEIRRHNLPIQACRCCTNRYDLTSFTVTVTTDD